MTLGYGNLEITATKALQGVVILKDTSYLDDIANMLQQPPHDFLGCGIKDAAGRFIHGTGFVFSNIEDAVAAANRIVQEVYQKKG